MLTLPIYRDEACTNLFENIPIRDLAYTGFSTPPYTIYIGAKPYSGMLYSSGSLKYLEGVGLYTDDPFLSWERSRLPSDTRLYFKNGLSVLCQERAESGGSAGAMQFDSIQYRGMVVTGQNNERIVNYLNHPIIVAFRVQYAGLTYIGFSVCQDTISWGYFQPYILVESKFWEEAFGPSYAYGTGSDIAGGTGSGKITGEQIGRSANPSFRLPTGGNGLHAYRINGTAYASIQGYLWGESSTIAKSLWQKFQNKIHSPVSCIVACYRLPEAFMPSGTSTNAVQLAGTKLAPIAGSCSEVGLGMISSVVLEFPPVEAPFASFLDFTGVSCKIHIPLCGEIGVPVEEVYGRTVRIWYRVDQQNGNLAAFIEADGIPIAELTGNCGYPVPVVGGDDGTLERLGALATAAVQWYAGMKKEAATSIGSALGVGHETSIANANLAGSVSACLNGRAYMMWDYPTTSYPDGYGHDKGYPARGASGMLSTFSGGYGEFEINAADDWISGATDREKQEIIEALRGGVIV